MAIKLSENTFTVIPEGKHVFKIVEVNYDADFGKMEIQLVTEDGLKQTERFMLIDQTGEYNSKALSAFSYFARTAMNKPNLDEIEERDLVGKYIAAEAVHTKTPSKNDPSKIMSFVNLKNYEPAAGFPTRIKQEDTFSL